MIVDDEIDVREGIRDRIDWDELGLRVAGDYGDGRGALEAARVEPPDLILTDIRMPHLDGIQLASAVAAELPETTVVLLTGHDEFEYAHAALRLQVQDFLLKPISAAELRTALLAVVERVQRQRRRAVAAAQVRKRWEASLPMLRERALEALLTGSRPVEEALARCRDLELDLPSGRCRAILISPDPGSTADGDSAPADARVLELGALVDRVVAVRPSTVRAAIHDDAVAVIWCGTDDDLAERLERLRRESVESAVGPVSIGVGVAGGRLADLRSSYRDAKRLLARRFLEGGDAVFSAARPDVQRHRADGHREIRTTLITALRAIDRAGVEAAVGRLVATYRESGCEVDACILGLQRDLARILEAGEELGLDVPATLGPASQGNPFLTLAAATSLDHVGELLTEMLARFLDELEEMRRTSRDRAVRAAEQYIREHFRDADLSLTELCDRLAVSVSHFSQSFKRATGRTFVEYVTDVRIEAAQALLRQGDIRSYEIAPLVGFRDPHYFSRAFKKASGLAPTEYRSQVAGDAP